MRVLRFREVVKLLESKGWRLARVTGSHHVYRREGFPPVVVPGNGGKEIKIGTLRSILKQTGIDEEEFK